MRNNIYQVGGEMKTWQRRTGAEGESRETLKEKMVSFYCMVPFLSKKLIKLYFTHPHLKKINSRRASEILLTVTLPSRYLLQGRQVAEIERCSNVI